MRKNSSPKQTTLRAKIKIKACGSEHIGTPEGFGMRASNGKFYNRSEYSVLRRFEVKANV